MFHYKGTYLRFNCKIRKLPSATGCGNGFRSGFDLKEKYGSWPLVRIRNFFTGSGSVKKTPDPTLISNHNIESNCNFFSREMKIFFDGKTFVMQVER